MKILIASHGKLASGMKSALDIFVDTKNISTIDAYVDGGGDYSADIQNFIDQTKDEEVSVIFTDLIGGSVNQKCTAINYKKNVKIISGFNIALVLEIVLSDIKEDEELRKVICKARDQMQLIESCSNIGDEETEDSFLNE